MRRINTKSIFDLVTRIRNIIVDSVMYRSLIWRDADARQWLDKNKEFNNMHKGQRCFILGNGPSLKTEDLSMIRDEIVFTVNQVNRIPDYGKFISSYHFWVDESFFNIDTDKPEDKELLEVMGSIGKDKPVCFFPLEQREFCKRHRLHEKLNIRFIANKPSVTLIDGYNRKIDMAKLLPGFGTVVQYCIISAIYMGFSEIYLLGCDNTGIMVTLKTALLENDEKDYAYIITANETKRMISLLERNTVERYAISYAATLTAYRILNDYCIRRNIKLVNCSSSTVIDSISRNSLRNILKEKPFDDD